MLHPTHLTLERMAPLISDPHPKWRTDLNETDRKSKWKYAAGDGKSPEQHTEARKYFTRTANEESAKAKNGVGLTLEDEKVLKNKKDRVSRDSDSKRARMERPGKRGEYNAKQRAYIEKPENCEKNIAKSRAKREIPENREKNNAKQRARNKIPKNRERNKANSLARHKENRDSLQVERAAEN